MKKNSPIEIEILRAGTHKASDGRECSFSVEDLHQVAANYNPNNFRAPIIISHNVGNVPDKSVVDSELAHGFPTSLKVAGDRLIALCEKVSPQFKEWFKNHQLLSFSSSLYLPNSPSNPTPGKLALRHIAALGTSPPAIKGLKPLTLAEGVFPCNKSIFNLGETNDLIIDLNCPLCIGNEMETTTPITALIALLRGMRDYLIESKDLATADSILPADTLDQISINQTSDDQLQQTISMLATKIAELVNRVSRLESEEETEEPEGQAMPMTTEMETEFSELRQQLLLSQIQVKELEKGIKERDIASFVEEMKASGKLLPSQLEHREIEFSEHDKWSGNIVNFMANLDEKQLTIFKDWLKGTPKKIDYSEISGDDGLMNFGMSETRSNIKFDAQSQELDRRIRAFQLQNPALTYAEAAKQIGVFKN